MNRRELLLGGLAMAGTALAGRAVAAEHNHEVMAQHHHDAPYAALALATSDCLQKGQACLSHCLVLLGQGDKDMAACAQSVNQMMALCGALQQLANQNSKQLVRVAAIAMDVCKQCEDECKKHADDHEVCKACAESCAACYKECKKIVI
jgi:Cys-rich four helix bundle protein (predicted Tat secretion target)